MENLYAKVSEIRNSISHLERSNKELEEYSDGVGEDADCLAAVRENEEVIKRLNDRIELVKNEVVRRGQRWHEGAVNGESNGEVPAGGTLSDGELRSQMAERMAEVDEEAEEGLHL